MDHQQGFPKTMEWRPTLSKTNKKNRRIRQNYKLNNVQTIKTVLTKISRSNRNNKLKKTLILKNRKDFWIGNKDSRSKQITIKKSCFKHNLVQNMIGNLLRKMKRLSQYDFSTLDHLNLRLKRNWIQAGFLIRVHNFNKTQLEFKISKLDLNKNKSQI